MRKIFLGVSFLTISFIIGLVFLMRGCLAKYDERFALMPALTFDIDHKPLIVSIIQYSKTTSYSQEGGFIQKTMNTDYLIQCNDGKDGHVLRTANLKNHRELKNYTVETIGASCDKAWLYVGELMSFNPLTLEKIADTKTLEQKNPALLNKFPHERKYYSFDMRDSLIHFTAIDGFKWKILSDGVSIVEDEYPDATKSLSASLAAISVLEMKNIAEQNSIQFENIEIHQLANERKLSGDKYAHRLTALSKKRQVVYRQRDSIEKLKVETAGNAVKQIESSPVFNNFQKISSDYYHSKTNADTANGKWFGLYPKNELAQLHDQFQLDNANDETAPRSLVMAVLARDNNNNLVIDKKHAQQISSGTFLNAGFLLDKKTSLPIHYENGWLIISKDQIGREGGICINQVSYQGHSSWSFNTKLNEWIDWVYTGDYLYVFGRDNEQLSSTQCNVLWCISLSTGKASKFDFFNQKND